MVLLIILTIILIASILIAQRSYDFEFLGVIGSIISGSCLFLALVMLPLSRMKCKEFVIQYTEFKNTVTHARSDPKLTEYERAALTIKISEYNGEIASYKYYNTIWDLWITDEVIELKPFY